MRNRYGGLSDAENDCEMIEGTQQQGGSGSTGDALVTLTGVPLAQAGLIADALPQIVGGIAAIWAVFTPEQAPEQGEYRKNGKAG